VEWQELGFGCVESDTPTRHPHGNVSRKATHKGWNSKDRPGQYNFRGKDMLFKTSKPDTITMEVQSFFVSLMSLHLLRRIVAVLALPCHDFFVG